MGITIPGPVTTGQSECDLFFSFQTTVNLKSWGFFDTINVQRFRCKQCCY